jgi:FSR family fosmidomycin resistance protein-like MFS transporter
MQSTTILGRLSSGPFYISVGHLSLELSNNFLPVAYPLFIQELGLNYAQVGTIALVTIAAATLLQPLFGYLSDRFDSRLLMLFSLIWIGTIMGLSGLVRSYGLLLLVVGLGGLGSAAFHPAAAALTSAVAGRRRGVSMSVFSVGGNLGAALSPLIIGAALVRLGLPGTLLLVPILWLFSLFLYRQFAKLPADSSLAKDKDGKLQRAVETGPWLALVLVVIIAASRSWFHAALSAYLPEWLQGQGWTPESAGALLSVLLGSVAVGSLTGGTLSDRVGRVPVAFISFLLMAPAIYLLLHTTGVLQVICVSLAGVLVGATFPVTLLMAQEAWPRAVGLASSLAIGIGWLPGGVGAWAVGYVADRASLSFALSTLIGAPLVGLVTVVLYRMRYGR